MRRDRVRAAPQIAIRHKTQRRGGFPQSGGGAGETILKKALQKRTENRYDNFADWIGRIVGEGRVSGPFEEGAIFFKITKLGGIEKLVTMCKVWKKEVPDGIPPPSIGNAITVGMQQELDVVPIDENGVHVAEVGGDLYIAIVQTLSNTQDLSTYIGQLQKKSAEERLQKGLTMVQEICTMVLAFHSQGYFIADAIKRAIEDAIAIEGGRETMRETIRIDGNIPKCVNLMHIISKNNQSYLSRDNYTHNIHFYRNFWSQQNAQFKQLKNIILGEEREEVEVLRFVRISLLKDDVMAVQNLLVYLIDTLKLRISSADRSGPIKDHVKKLFDTAIKSIEFLIPPVGVVERAASGQHRGIEPESDAQKDKDKLCQQRIQDRWGFDFKDLIPYIRRIIDPELLIEKYRDINDNLYYYALICFNTSQERQINSVHYKGLGKKTQFSEDKTDLDCFEIPKYPDGKSVLKLIQR